jgi:hypothetical protein
MALTGQKQTVITVCFLVTRLVDAAPEAITSRSPERPPKREAAIHGCQHTMEADHWQHGPWHQRCQPLHEFQRRHHQVGCDVAAQLLQRVAVVSPAAHGSVKTEAVNVGT